jgi:transposase
MQIVSALDVHRQQITFKTLDLENGEVERGRILPVTRERVREWLRPFQARDAHIALEGTTGWRFLVEEIEAAGLTAHLADPAETAAKRGRKRRAKTDRADCEHLLQLLLAGQLPESWVPPSHLLELRGRVRLRKALVDERRQWQQRMQAQLFHQGVRAGIQLTSAAGRAEVATLHLTPAGRQLLEVGLRMLDRLDVELRPLDAQLRAFARRQPGCRALVERLFGVGPLTSVAILAELGDCRRFASSDDAVRHTGLDVTVFASDERRAPGHLSRQGPELLRWALFEAAQSAAKRSSPDHAYYLEVRQRLNHKRACLSVARKLCRRAHHILRELGDDALAPAEPALAQPA